MRALGLYPVVDEALGNNPCLPHPGYGPVLAVAAARDLRSLVVA